MADNDLIESSDIKSKSVSIEIDDDDALSGGSTLKTFREKNLSTDEFKLFERLSGSIDKRKNGRIMYTNLEKVTKSVDVISHSPDNKFVASWCKLDGLLTVWAVDKRRRSQLLPIFTTTTPFNESSLSDSKIYISISDEGEYVSVSRVKILPFEEDEESPNMEIYGTKKLKKFSEINVPKSSFVVYSTFSNPLTRESISLDDFVITSPLFFVRDSRLVFFTLRKMCVYSTKNWKMINTVNVTKLMPAKFEESELTEQFYWDIFSNLFMNSLKYGFVILPEQHNENNGFSLWDLDGSMKQWFYIDSEYEIHDNLCAITDDGDLIARLNISLNTLTIYHVRSGLTIREFDVPKNAFYISFLPDTDQIIVCSRKKNSNYVLTQLFNCWSGYIIKQDSYFSVDNKVDQLLFVGDRFIHIFNNELKLSSLFPNNLTSLNVEPLLKKNEESNPSQDLLLDIMIDGNAEQSICWCRILNKEEKELCRFKFEPWRYYETPYIFLRWLDDTQFLMVGVDSVQVYDLKAKGSLLQVELKYIWVASSNDIQGALLKISEDHENNDEDDDDKEVDEYKYIMGNNKVNKKQYLFVQLTNDHVEKLLISSDETNDQEFNYRVLQDACISLSFLRLQYESNIIHFNRVTISNQIKRLIQNSVESFPAAFTKIYLDDGQSIFPVKEFILVDWDKTLKDILKGDQYIPLFHDQKETESAISLLIQLQKSELLDLLVSYILKHVRQRYDNPSLRQSGFAWTLGKSLLDLHGYCPDIATRVLKESSYFTISSETNTRILQKSIGNDERSVNFHLQPIGVNEYIAMNFDPFDKRLSESGFFFKKQKSESLSDVISISNSSNLTFYETNQGRQIGKKIDGKTIKKQELSSSPKTHPAKLCVVPWLDFCVYPTLEPKDASLYGSIKRFWDTYVSPGQLSPFVRIAFQGPSEMFDSIAMEAVIKYKWETFARRRCIISFLFYLVYATIFCITISIENNLLPDGPYDRRNYLMLIILIMASCSLLQEVRQLIGYRNGYFFILSNYVDIISYIFPFVTCILVLCVKIEPPEWIKSYSVLVVWLNVTLYARTFAGPGRFIVIVIQIVKRIAVLILTLLIIVASFANALFVLLRDDIPLEHAENQWTNYFDSLFAAWKFLGISWSAIEVFNHKWSINIMMLLFSFLTVIILLNVLIGLVTEVFSGSLQVGRQIWLKQRAELIAELELFLLFPYERKRSDWFPRLIYYECNLDQIKKWETELSQDNLNVEFIKRELKFTYDSINEKLIELNEKMSRLESRNEIMGR